jgi:hypothetical protein
VNLATYLRFLFGQRQAILDAASTKGLLWLGLLFVLSAGLAREYDAEDLLHEPWHVLLPLGASIAGSILLYAVIRPVAWKHHVGEAIDWRGYQTFLGFYWLTAPLAWLYAIPFERFLAPLEAAQANLALLALVSVWRVLLITRVASVWLGAPFWAMLMPVMLFADSVVLVLAGGRVFTLTMAGMGGVPPEGVDRWIGEVAGWVATAAFWSWLAWLFGATVGTGSKRWAAAALPEGRVVDRGLWGMGIVALAVGGVSLFWTQPEQRLRRQAETLMREGKLANAVKLMSSHARDDFPPSWNPPPRHGQWSPTGLDMLWTATRDHQSATWVRDLYLAKFRTELGEQMSSSRHVGGNMDRILDVLEALPEGPRLASEHAAKLRQSMSSSLLAPSQQRLSKLVLAAEGAGAGDPQAAPEAPP